MDLGHSHRRAVLLLYFWSAVLAFGAVAMSVSSGPWLVLAVVAALLAAGAAGDRHPAAALGPAVTRLLAGVRRRPIRSRWPLAAGGRPAARASLLFAAVSPPAAACRAELSPAAWCWSALIVEIRRLQHPLAGRLLPELTLPVAMLSYAMTALALALVLVASSPRVVDGPGVAVGPVRRRGDLARR